MGAPVAFFGVSFRGRGLHRTSKPGVIESLSFMSSTALLTQDGPAKSRSGPQAVPAADLSRDDSRHPVTISRGGSPGHYSPPGGAVVSTITPQDIDLEQDRGGEGIITRLRRQVALLGEAEQPREGVSYEVYRKCPREGVSLHALARLVGEPQQRRGDVRRRPHVGGELEHLSKARRRV